MADVFISYKSERRAAAEHLAEILADYGYSVWWDYGLLTGRDFGSQIENELRSAKAVVILWCSLSRTSEWVLDEATVAKGLGTALPCMIERVDLPLGFGRTQTIDLSDWDGSPESHKLDRLVREIARLVGREPQRNEEGLLRTERAWRRFGAPALRTFGLIDPLERSVPTRTLPGVLAAQVEKRQSPPAAEAAPPVAPIAVAPTTPSPGPATPEPVASLPRGSGAPREGKPWLRWALAGGAVVAAGAFLTLGVMIGRGYNAAESDLSDTATAAAAPSATVDLAAAAVTSFTKAMAAPPTEPAAAPAPGFDVEPYTPPWELAAASSGLQARAEPNMDSGEIGRVRTNRAMSVTGRTVVDGVVWLQVTLSGGEVGYVREADTAHFTPALAAPAAPAPSGPSQAIVGLWMETYDSDMQCDPYQAIAYSGGSDFTRTSGETSYYSIDQGVLTWSYGTTYVGNETWTVDGNTLTRVPSDGYWTCIFTRQ